MKPVRTATFNGRKYKIDCDTGVDGWCDQYGLNERYIHIHKPLNTKDGLVTAIHEMLHASNWSKSEKDVDRISIEIGRTLWRLGYRCKNE